jgi:hypothetical protein
MALQICMLSAYFFLRPFKIVWLGNKSQPVLSNNKRFCKQIYFNCSSGASVETHKKDWIGNIYGLVEKCNINETLCEKLKLKKPRDNSGRKNPSARNRLLVFFA